MAYAPIGAMIRQINTHGWGKATIERTPPMGMSAFCAPHEFIRDPLKNSGPACYSFKV
jgi:hypothetical protein